MIVKIENKTTNELNITLPVDLKYLVIGPGKSVVINELYKDNVNYLVNYAKVLGVAVTVDKPVKKVLNESKPVVKKEVVVEKPDVEAVAEEKVEEPKAEAVRKPPTRRKKVSL